MAFAGLFSRLTAAEEPAGPAPTHRNETQSGGRGRGSKRRGPAEQTGPEKKKRCYQAHTTGAYDATPFKDDDNTEARRYQMPHAAGERARFGFTKGNNAGYGNMCHRDGNHRTKTNQEKKREPRKIQHQQKDRGRHGNGGHQNRATSRKGGWENKKQNAKKAVEVKRTRSMTQEFMDQNALLVGGRFLCRHFLWGRCIKGDDCQLEHTQGYNDLIKEVCKFYVQGFCTKGGSCPYMHKSFPCKFFHRKGKCTQGAECRFSHEPLDDVTNQLLDEALKRENDLYELAKKAEQESSGQPANTEESETAEANRTPDILSQPIRPNFYQSADTDFEKETSLSQTGELADVVEANPAHASDGAQPHSSPSANPDHKEPVCYSVEAVLGPQISKPFPSFCPTPGSQESAPLSSFGCTSGSADQKEVPYSVSAVLRSCKSVEYVAFGHAPTAPTAQTVSYIPKTDFEEVTEPLLSSETLTEKILHSENTTNEANKSQEKRFKSSPSLQEDTSLISKSSPNLSPTSGDDAVSVDCKSENVLPFGPTLYKNIFSRPPSQMPASKQLQPHISVLTPDSQASVKPLRPSSGFTESKGRAAVPVEPVTISCKTGGSTNSVSGHFAAKPTDIHLHSETTPTNLEVGAIEHLSPDDTAECGRKAAHCDELAVECKETQKRSCLSPFVYPTAVTLRPTADSETGSSCPQSLVQSSCPAPQSADCRSNYLKPEPDKASASPFLSLFAAPLRAAPLPYMQSQPDYSKTSTLSEHSKQSVDHTSHLSDSKQRTPNLETPLLHQITADVNESLHVPRSLNSSPHPKVGNEDCSLEHINQPIKQLVNPVCSLLSDSVSEMPSSAAPHANSPSAAPAHQQGPDISSHKGSAAGATENSVLKTLFLSLSPFQQDGEEQDDIQTSVPSESEKKDVSSTECVSEKQKKSKNKGRRKEKLKAQDSHKQSTEHQPSPHTPQNSFKATGGSILRPGMTEPQVRNFGTHNLPLKPEVPPMQHHSRPRLKHTSEEGKCGNGNVAPTPLKDLFKTLDATVFHFGH